MNEREFNIFPLLVIGFAAALGGIFSGTAALIGVVVAIFAIVLVDTLVNW